MLDRQTVAGCLTRLDHSGHVRNFMFIWKGIYGRFLRRGGGCQCSVKTTLVAHGEKIGRVRIPGASSMLSNVLGNVKNFIDICILRDGEKLYVQKTIIGYYKTACIQVLFYGFAHYLLQEFWEGAKR